MFGIGETEFAIILVFGFLLFGPDKLPGVGRTLGRALRQFREAEEGLTKVVQAEIVDPMNAAARGENDVITEEQAQAASVASDEDLPDPNASAPKESFAERKARMEVEAKAGAEETPAAQLAVDPASDDDLPDEEVPASEVVEAKEEAQPAPRSAASLYGLDDESADDVQAGEEGSDTSAE